MVATRPLGVEEPAQSLGVPGLHLGGCVLAPRLWGGVLSRQGCGSFAPSAQRRRVPGRGRYGRIGPSVHERPPGLPSSRPSVEKVGIEPVEHPGVDGFEAEPAEVRDHVESEVALVGRPCRLLDRDLDRRQPLVRQVLGEACLAGGARTHPAGPRRAARRARPGPPALVLNPRRFAWRRRPSGPGGRSTTNHHVRDRGSFLGTTDPVIDQCLVGSYRLHPPRRRPE